MSASSLKMGYLRVESPAAIIQRAKVKQPTARCSKSVLSISYSTSMVSDEVQKHLLSTCGIISSNIRLDLLDIPNSKPISAKRIMAVL